MQPVMKLRMTAITQIRKLPGRPEETNKNVITGATTADYIYYRGNSRGREEILWLAESLTGNGRGKLS